MTPQTAIRQDETTAGDVDAVQHLLDAIGCMAKARERIGTRSCAYDLLDVARAIEEALPPVRATLRHRHDGEMPLHLRVELSILFRAATRCEELGSAGIGVIPPSRQDMQALGGQLDAWERCAEGLVEGLDIEPDSAA